MNADNSPANVADDSHANVADNSPTNVADDSPTDVPDNSPANVAPANVFANVNDNPPAPTSPGDNADDESIDENDEDCVSVHSGDFFMYMNAHVF